MVKVGILIRRVRGIPCLVEVIERDVGVLDNEIGLQRY